MLRRALQRRRMMRRLRELDRLDAELGLGMMPEAPVRPARDRTTSGLVLVISVFVVVSVLLISGQVLPNAWMNRVGLGQQPLGHAPPAGDSTSYTFLRTQPGSAKPVAWDPCKEIKYAVNPAGGPDEAVGMVQESVAEVSRLTGLQFAYVGTTGDRPRWGERRSWVPQSDSYAVLVSWATEDEVAQLSGDIAGIGGSTAMGLRGGGAMRYVDGGATLDIEAFDELNHAPRGRILQRAIVLHELGHVVGLGHVDDPSQLMHESNLGVVEFQAGDRAGLARLGSGTCF